MKEKELISFFKKDENILRVVVEKLFTFGDLNKSLADVDSSVGNINCPFHPAEGEGVNKSKSAKVYYDEDKNIYTITCFTVKRVYSSYDYIKLAMEEDPITYLLKHRSLQDISDIVDMLKKGYIKIENNNVEEFYNYVNNVFEECDCNTVEFIERILTVE